MPVASQKEPFFTKLHVFAAQLDSTPAQVLPIPKPLPVQPKLGPSRLQMTNASSFKAFTEMGFKTHYKKTTKNISPSGSTKMLAETTRDPPTTLRKEFVSPEGHTVLVDGQRVQIKAARQTTP